MYYNYPEKRVHERFGRDELVQCRPVDGQEFVPARLVDYSRGGVFIEVERFFPPGMEVVLKPSGCRPENVGDMTGELISGIVIWSRTQGKRGHEGFGSGIRFLTPNVL